MQCNISCFERILHHSIIFRLNDEMGERCERSESKIDMVRVGDREKYDEIDRERGKEVDDVRPGKKSKRRAGIRKTELN